MLDRRSDQRGFTIVELMIGIVVFVVTVVVLGNHITVNYQTTNAQRERVHAYNKAQAILAEIQAFVDRGQATTAGDLDVLDDGTGHVPTLTIAESGGALVAPDHPLSGNRIRRGDWYWSRRITVEQFSGLANRNVRYVTVKIFRLADDGNRHEMASLSATVNTIGTSFPATQVFDTYLIAIDNVPSWWMHHEAIHPFVESLITDLENRNPGLELRTHWITKLAYGRNEMYRPYVNEAVDSLQTVPECYYYPGRMPGWAGSSFYYNSSLMKGRISVDGFEKNGYDAALNPYPYAMADVFNHAMRYPAAKEFHDLRIAAVRQRQADIDDAIKNGTPKPDPLDDMSTEPPLQLFLEDLNASPDKYRNALIVNLHGEMLPMPPLRNYSDAAKDPVNLPFVRVVTHPEELRTRRPDGGGGYAGDPVVLRVHAYTTDPQRYWASALPKRMPITRPIAIQVMDLDLTAGAPNTLHSGVTIENIAGGVPVGGSADYSRQNAKDSADPTLVAGEMFFRSSFVDPGVGERKYTLLTLHNTPVIAPPVKHSVSGEIHGLNNDRRARLYGLEYVPSSPQKDDFQVDLATDGVAVGPKNTARWIITLPPGLFKDKHFVSAGGSFHNPLMTTEPDRTVAIRTRIIDPGATDQFGNAVDPMLTGTWPAGIETRIIQPDNFSETYTWWSRSRDAVPFVERSQFIGDPRHNPYKDLLDGDPDFPDGYNWFHDALVNTTTGEDARPDFPGLKFLRRRWSGVREDAPRLFQLLRDGVVGSQAFFSSMTGAPATYLGVGGEIAAGPETGYPNSVPINVNPFGYGATSAAYYDDVKGRTVGMWQARCYLLHYHYTAPTYWSFALPWLGEMCDDAVYASEYAATDVSGHVRGNVNAGNVVGTSFRYPEWWVSDNNVSKFVTAWGNSTGQANTGSGLLGPMGLVGLFNDDNGGGHVNQYVGTATGDVIGSGLEIVDEYNSQFALTATVTKPYTLSTTGNEGFERGLPPYSGDRHGTTQLADFVDFPTSGFAGLGLVELVDPTKSDAGLVLLNGLDGTQAGGNVTKTTEFTLLSLVHSYFVKGEPGTDFRIEQPPRVEILTPTDITELVKPTDIEIRLATDWVRWDGHPYAKTFTTPIESEASLQYVLMYSRDDGASWKHVLDDSPATPGVRPLDPALLLNDAGVGDEVYNWPVPAMAFPEDFYLLRVDAFRIGQEQHYSQHQTKIFIQRW